MQRARSPELKEVPRGWRRAMASPISALRFLSSPSPNRPERGSHPTIFRVPNNIRSCDPPSYTPQVVSIGPYHHPDYGSTRLDNEDLVVSHEEYKLLCVRFLLSPRRHGGKAKAHSMLNSCLTRIQERIQEIRSCYSANIRVTDHLLVKLMLLDGCFIIRHLLQQNRVQPPADAAHSITIDVMKGDDDGTQPAPVGNGDGNFNSITVDVMEGEDDGTEAGPLLGMPWIWKLVDYDLLKLENQIPFFVLKDLFELLHTSLGIGDGVTLVDLALKCFHEIRPSRANSSPANGHQLGEDCKHLLHLFYSSRLPPTPPVPEAATEEDNYHDQCALSCEWIPSATELRQAGVAFKENKQQGESFLKVSFEHGVMKIPRLSIFDYTKPLFRNLIAFEQCYPFLTWTRITTYAVFMDCLVDTAQDVNLLRLSGVLLNRVSTDQAVADLFNNLTDQIHYSVDRNYLHKVFLDVNKYHQSRWHLYRAGLVRDYFSNPWAIISVIAAAVVILLTALQTFYAVYDHYT